MNISRTTFVILFLVFGFAFLFGTSLILNQPPESFFGAENQAAWQSAASRILSPVKVVLIGPLLPLINFLHKDPDTPPPFFLALFAFYWVLLALALHYLLARKKPDRLPGSPRKGTVR